MKPKRIRKPKKLAKPVPDLKKRPLPSRIAGYLTTQMTRWWTR